MSKRGSTITNLQTFIERITSDPVPPGKVVVYRGHPDKSFILQPAVFRSAVRAEREHLLLRDLIAGHPEEFNSDTSALEQLVRMQHYGLPTRLLDVTWNPMVALYFASEAFEKKVKLAALRKNGEPKESTIATNGEVIRLTIDEKLVRYFDSDAISCLTNLARCRLDQKDEIRRLTAGKTVFSEEESTEFNKDKTVRRLLHFIRGEKPAFEPEIEPLQLHQNFLVKPKMGNPRILAQEGAFIVFGLADEMDAAGGEGILVERFPILRRYKEGIMRQLKLMSINQRTLFPEIDRAARYLTDELPIAELLSRGAGLTPGKHSSRSSDGGRRST